MSTPAFSAAWMQFIFSLPMSTGTSDTDSLPMVAWITLAGAWPFVVGLMETKTVAIMSLTPRPDATVGPVCNRPVEHGRLQTGPTAPLGSRAYSVRADQRQRVRLLAALDVLLELAA